MVHVKARSRFFWVRVGKVPHQPGMLHLHVDGFLEVKSRECDSY